MKFIRLPFSTSNQKLSYCSQLQHYLTLHLSPPLPSFTFPIPPPLSTSHLPQTTTIIHLPHTTTNLHLSSSPPLPSPNHTLHYSTLPHAHKFHVVTQNFSKPHSSGHTHTHTNTHTHTHTHIHTHAHHTHTPVLLSRYPQVGCSCLPGVTRGSGALHCPSSPSSASAQRRFCAMTTQQT